MGAPTTEAPAAEAAAPAKLVAKLAKAMQDAGEVTKNSRNAEQGYNYASAEDILKAVRAPLLKQGLILLPRVRNSEEKDIRSRSGTEGTRITLEVDFTFMDGETGEVLTIQAWRGEGQDYGDKAYGKAYTNAIKTLIRSAWLLPTGDDPEATPPGERMAKANGTPPWAAAAGTDAKAKMLDVLTEAIGDRKMATAYAKMLADTIGQMPGVVASWLAALPAWQERARQASSGAMKPPEDVVEAERAAAAEKAAQEASGEPEEAPAEDGPGDHDASEEPPPGELTDPDQPAVASLDDTEENREKWCTCESPPAIGETTQEDDQTDDACPIQGHGIGF